MSSPSRRTFKDGLLSHDDLLDALMEALDLAGREDRSAIRDRYFTTLASAAEAQGDVPAAESLRRRGGAA